MRIFMAGLATETNTFSPIPTGASGFAETALFRGDATRHPPMLFSEPLHVWRQRAESDGHEVVEGLLAAAQPAGRTVGPVYRGFRDEILDGLRAAMPVDLVLLSMHGAMVAEDEDDCEGDVLARVREIVGERVPVGVELDLHCHLTQRMADCASVIVTYKEYPHVDAGERAEEVYRLCIDTAEGRLDPRISLYDCRMIGMWRTPVEPAKGFVTRMKALEGKDGIASVSFGHGFPWADVADVGAKMLVVSDGDAAAGAALAERLGRELWSLREATRQAHEDIDSALDLALAASDGPVVLADTADNAGGGAPGDSTFILRRCLERGVSAATLGFFWDPIAVRFCLDAGEGAELDLRIGGKCGPFSGDPVDLPVRVRRLLRDASQPFGKGSMRLGDSVWISAAGLNLFLCATRTQTFHPDAFSQFGHDPAQDKIVVVKSSQHFYAGFAPVASGIVYVAAPGAISPDFAAIPYTKRTTAIWPRSADPFAE